MTGPRKSNEVGLHVVGYVEEELRRIVGGVDHRDRVFAEALLILLQRTEPVDRPWTGLR